VDGCITKAPAGGERAGRSPVDRGKQGLKRSVLTEGAGVPLHLVSAGANRHDAPLLPATLAGLEKVAALTAAEPGTVHLDRGYDSGPKRALLDELGLEGDIARKGVPAPRQAGSRWTVERTHSWMNGYGKLRRCTEKRRAVVEFHLFLAVALVVLVLGIIRHASKSRANVTNDPAPRVQHTTRLADVVTSSFATARRYSARMQVDFQATSYRFRILA